MNDLMFLFSSKQTRSIKKMALELNITKGETIAKSLALLEVVLKEIKKGGTLNVIRKNKEVREIIGILND